MSNNIYVLHVTLDTNTTPWSLHVDESGDANEVDPDPLLQTIIWVLDSSVDGTFNDPKAAKDPGFAWASEPPPGKDIFSDPRRGKDGKLLLMHDNNSQAAPAQEWSYRLCVTLHGVVYRTKAGLSVTGNNPTIKNN